MGYFLLRTASTRLYVRPVSSCGFFHSLLKCIAHGAVSTTFRKGHLFRHVEYRIAHATFSLAQPFLGLNLDIKCFKAFEASCSQRAVCPRRGQSILDVRTRTP